MSNVKCKALVSSIGTPNLKKGGIYFFSEVEATDFKKRGFIEILEIKKPEKAISKKRPSTRTRKRNK